MIAKLLLAACALAAAAPAPPAPKEEYQLLKTVYLELPWGEGDHTPPHQASRTLIEDSQPVGPGAFAVDSKGRILLTDNRMSRLQMFEPGGRLAKHLQFDIVSETVHGLALGSDGRVFVLVRKGDLDFIHVFDPELKRVGIIDYSPSTLTFANAQAVPFQGPTAIEVDPKGGLYLFDEAVGKTMFVSSEGKILREMQDYKGYTLMCRGQAVIEVEMDEGERGLATLRSLDGNKLWTTPTSSYQVGGCSDRHALFVVESEVKPGKTRTDLYRVSLADGKAQRVQVPQRDAEHTLLSQGVADEWKYDDRWIAPDGTLYLQGDPAADKFRIYKVQVLPR